RRSGRTARFYGGNGVKSQHLTFIPSNSSAVLIEKLTYFPQHFAEFRCLHFSDRVKNEVVFNGEKSFSSDGNHGSRFDGTRLGLVGDQLPQERNQHDKRNTDREAAEAKLREQLRVPGVGSDRCGAGRLGDHSREVACKERRESG